MVYSTPEKQLKQAEFEDFDIPNKPLAENLDPKSRYYDVGGIEVLNVIKAKLTKEQYTGYLLGCSIKYSLRMNWKHTDKNGIMRDAQKLAIYTKNLQVHLEGQQ